MVTCQPVMVGRAVTEMVKPQQSWITWQKVVATQLERFRLDIWEDWTTGWVLQPQELGDLHLWRVARPVLVPVPVLLQAGCTQALPVDVPHTELADLLVVPTEWAGAAPSSEGQLMSWAIHHHCSYLA